jgi:tRNA pseudouridine55 synthase
MLQNARMAIPRTVTLQKRRGETPLEAIQKWKMLHPQYANTPTSYAGRLDPMAEGKLLVLIGDECKRQPHYTKLDKEYVIEVLFDFSTDTGDVLGLPSYSGKEVNVLEKNVRVALEHERGAHSRAYPVFSSKTVNGTPLFVYALQGTLSTIQIPEHIETLYSIKLLNIRTENSAKLYESIKNFLTDVPRSSDPSKALGADFRQDEIRERWSEQFKSIPERNFYVATLTVTCGSGTYMRTLAQRIGKSLGTGALALSIKRTKIGKYTQLGPLSFWSSQY